MTRTSASLLSASPRHNTLSIAEPRRKREPEPQPELPHIERAPIVRKRGTIIKAFSAYEMAVAKARKMKGRPGAYAAAAGARADAVTAGDNAGTGLWAHYDARSELADLERVQKVSATRTLTERQTAEATIQTAPWLSWP